MDNSRYRGDLYSRVVRHIVAPLWAVKERSPYLRHLKYLKQSPYRPADEVKRDQWSRFKELLDHAYENTEFYRKALDARGLAPAAIRTWNDFVQLPLLTKEAIRANKEAIIAGNIAPENLQSKKTSGSTGVSLEFCVDKDSLQWKRACAIRHDRWTGWELGERIAGLWGNPECSKSRRGRLRNFLLERATYLDTLKMDEKAMMDFHCRITRERPALLFGHAHSLYLFSRFLSSKGLPPVKVKGIISTAMVLHDFERKAIESVFNCKVTNRYGCEEVSLIACECGAHNGLHINMDTLIVEFVKEGKQAQPGEPGAIVVTDLTNKGMPFIRYKVGDIGILSGRSCTCGCAYPLIESLEGRIADYIRTPEGNYISGISLTENFAVQISGIKQLQIIQEKLDFLVFNIVRGERFSSSTVGEIGKLVAERFGTAMRYTLQFVDTIPQERSGKYRFCISRLDPGIGE